MFQLLQNLSHPRILSRRVGVILCYFFEEIFETEIFAIYIYVYILRERERIFAHGQLCLRWCRFHFPPTPALQIKKDFIENV